MAKQSRRPVSGKSPVSGSIRGSPADNHRDPAPVRSTYVEAVGIYEQALRTFQQQNFAKAADLFRHVISSFPDERELLDRVKLYITVCERHLTPPTAEPRNTEERLYAATLALNAGNPGGALTHLERVRQDDPANDRALYMLAVAHTQRGEPAVAIPYLEQAIEANGENRALARFDPDLEALRAEDAVVALLEAPSVARTTEHKRIARRK